VSLPFRKVEITNGIPIFISHLTEAKRRKMAGGWTRDGAVQDQIDDTVMDAVLAARATIPTGDSEPWCVLCGDDIPEGRRRALPGVKTCVTCQSGRDRPTASRFNRRGSKDSQLR
jgi:phage/conjugal plasmid C-4 type zinc finger TraR family protein